MSTHNHTPLKEKTTKQNSQALLKSNGEKMKRFRGTEYWSLCDSFNLAKQNMSSVLTLSYEHVQDQNKIKKQNQ